MHHDNVFECNKLAQLTTKKFPSLAMCEMHFYRVQRYSDCENNFVGKKYATVIEHCRITNAKRKKCQTNENLITFFVSTHHRLIIKIWMAAW